MISRRLASVTLASVLLAGCGGSSPAPSAPSTPAPAPIATPAPTPGATTYPNGQAVVRRFSVHVSWIQTPTGELRADREGPAHVGDLIRFDSDAKDANNKPTAGPGDDPFWFAGPGNENIGELLNTSGWNPKLRVVAPGRYIIRSHLAGVESPALFLTFLPAPTQ